MDMAGNPITALGDNLPGMDPVVIEQFAVPDTCVEQIFGRGGESITNIQQQTGCHIELSQSPYISQDGKHMRSCTLTGAKPSIDHAKKVIVERISEAMARSSTYLQATAAKYDGPPPPNRGGGGGGMGGGGRVLTCEMLIPAAKCGLVIGKSGETIKQLQKKAQVKMVMIQDNTQTTGMPKPLRIIGEAVKVEYAKCLVEELMASKDDGKGGSMMNDYGGGGGDNFMPKTMGEVMITVPRTTVDVIIGNDLDNIRRLTRDTGAQITINRLEEPNEPDQRIMIKGSPDQIYEARQLITGMVNRAVAAGEMNSGNSGYNRKGGGGEADVFYMHIPSAKAGLVIGKGGKTIKQICAESGARVELSRDPPANELEKIFVILATSQQIYHAHHLIRIRVGDIAANTPVPPFRGGDQQFSYPTNYGNPAAVGDPNAAAWAANYSQYYQQQGGATQNYTPSAAAGGGQPAQANNASSAHKFLCHKFF